MGSLTGVVASKSVTEASKGALRTIGNRPQSVMAKGRLTGRQTSRAGRKLEHSDPVFPYGRDIAQRIKSVHIWQIHQGQFKLFYSRELIINAVTFYYSLLCNLK